MTRPRVGILISGRGSNMEALIRAARAEGYPAEVAVVISNRPDAKGLTTARSLGIDALVVDHKSHGSRENFEAELQRRLAEHAVTHVALAGFMRVLTPAFIARWRDRIVNIHPSLLPAYRGLDTHSRVLAEGVKITGCTVHLVGPNVDDGPILAQAAVPVVPGDTAASLAERVLKAEHLLYPAALARLASGTVPEPRAPDAAATLFVPPLDATKS